MSPRSNGEACEALLAHVKDETTQQAAGLFTVPAADYLDEARWAKEIEHLFRRLPLLLAFSSELRGEGTYKTMEVAGLPLLIARGGDGIVRVFLNVCTHRGNLLAREARGQCSRFSCGYHGWTFAGDGKLIGVADKAKFGAFEQSSRNLVELPSAERGGLVFAVLTKGAKLDLEQFYGGMLAELERFKFQDWHFCGTREAIGPNWKIALDGYIESYHFAAAHPNTVLPYVFGNTMIFDTYGPHLRIGSPSRAILSRLEGVPKEQWGAKENNGYEFIRALFPNTPIFVGPELAQFSQVFPGPTPDTNRTVLNYLRRTPPADDAERAHIEQTMDFFSNTLKSEDYALGLDVQKGLQSGALESVLFGRNEAGNQFFHKCVDHYLNEERAPLPTL